MRDRPTPPDDTDLTWLLHDQEGVLSRRQALGLVGRDRLRRLLGTDRWQVVVSGVVVTHSGPLTGGQRLWSAVLSCGPDAVLAGVTAAVAGGLHRPVEQQPIHVLTRDDRRGDRCGVRRAAGILVHRTSMLLDKDVLPAGRPPRTTMARSLVDAAQWATGDDDARGIVAAGCQQRLVLPEEIAEVVDRMPRARRRSLIVETARMAGGAALLVAEIDFARLCRRARLPTPERQVERRDAAGRRRFLDVHWDRYRLRAEIDGGWPTSVDEWWTDMRRQNDRWISGDRVLRFPAWLVRERPADVVAQVRAALVVAGWRP